MLKQADPTVNLSASISLTTMKSLREIAMEVGLSRSKTANELLLMGIKQYQESKPIETTPDDKGDLS